MRTKKSSILLIALATLTLPVKLALADPAPKQNSAQLKKLSAQFEAGLEVSIPTSANPALDSTGANCVVGQSGSVWFLPTELSGVAITRTCSIPEGVSLYIQLGDLSDANQPGVCGQTGLLNVEQLRAIAKSYMDGATNLSVEVDGVPVKQINRVQSDVFVWAQPADNVQALFCPPGTSPAGIFSPAIDDGYYVLLQPLSVGPHTLRYTGTFPALSLNEDITYNLTVVPVTTQ